MATNMTRHTNRNNIKPMLFGIAGVVILFSWLLAVMTRQSIRTNQSVIPNSVPYSVTCLSFFGILKPIAFFQSGFNNFTFFGLSPAFVIIFYFLKMTESVSLCLFAMCFFTFFSLSMFLEILVLAILAEILIAVFHSKVFIKLRKWLNLFACGTLFCYDCFIHSLFPCKRLRSEPVSGYIPVSGLFYSNMGNRDYQ